MADAGFEIDTQASANIGGVVQDDCEVFEAAIAALRAELANTGAHLVIDAAARKAYDAQITAMANEIRTKAATGQITWKAAATEANAVRNTVMDVLRGNSTPVGRAVAVKMKSKGKTLARLLTEKTLDLYPDATHWDNLTSTQQNKVYAEVVKSAGKSNPGLTSKMRIASRAGRGLIILSVGLSVYTIATSDNPGETAVREGAVTASGIAGGFAGGALAGLACGPGAPVCVTVGAFVGGALAAFGVDYFAFD